MCCTGTSLVPHVRYRDLVGYQHVRLQVLVVVPHVRYRYEWWYHMCGTGTSCGTTCEVQVLVVVPHVRYRYEWWYHM